jgi:hypothetical protein
LAGEISTFFEVGKRKRAGFIEGTAAFGDDCVNRCQVAEKD